MQLEAASSSNVLDDRPPSTDCSTSLEEIWEDVAGDVFLQEYLFLFIGQSKGCGWEKDQEPTRCWSDFVPVAPEDLVWNITVSKIQDSPVLPTLWFVLCVAMNLMVGSSVPNRGRKSKIPCNDPRLGEDTVRDRMEMNEVSSWSHIVLHMNIRLLMDALRIRET
jgi:hypothetical protein